MNQAHLHLALNHLPIIFPMVGALILIAALLLKSEIMKRTAYGIFAAGAVLTMPAFFTGEGAEEVVEKLQGVSETLISNHEEMAEQFALLSYALGAASLLALWASWKRKNFANILSFIVLLLSFVVLFFAKNTGTSGGEIRHTEIRQGAAAAGNNNETGTNKEKEEKGDDD
ncbi:MAG: hypothetical protein WAT19_15705 [Ferruginibacter sp.]